jgi:release factor glutamine methyltransferase
MPEEPSPPQGRGLGEETVRTTLQSATQALTTVTDTPRLDAELLMAHALGVDRSALLLHHLNDPEPEAYASFIARRLAHEPLAYITGTRDFWTISLQVSPGVLIPRPDSETLIEAAVEHFMGCAPKTILDLGTGSGALLLAALSEWPEATGIGVDASDVAVAVAQTNAHALGLLNRSQVTKGDWAQGLEGPFDLILCNPPYVETDAMLTPEVMNEPHTALFAGPDGLDDYRRLAPQIAPLLSTNGCAVIEIGATQAGGAGSLFSEEGLHVRVRQDLGARDRCLLLTRLC